MIPTSKIAIVVLNWNGKRDTLACLHSLQKIDYPFFEVIVVDNGSSDDSLIAIRSEFPKALFIESKTNLGFAGGNNLGVQLALDRGARYVLLLNNDTVVAPDILKAFVDAASEGDILGAKLYLYHAPDTFDHFGGFWNREKGVFELVANRLKEDNKSWETAQVLDYVCGCALFIKREVFETIGLFEEKFFLIWEESDFCFRAKRAGFTSLFCAQAKLWHKVSASFVGGKPHSTYFWWRNRLLWIERNCSKQEKRYLFFRVILPEVLHVLKLRLIKTPLYFFSRQEEKQRRLLKYRAILCGVKDYFLRRFGNGPSWIYKA
jgi:GT2 family glycosyltransferase